MYKKLLPSNMLFKDLDNSELIEHIEIIKQLAAEQFSVYIEDPNTI